jgi:cytoskeleton protein RodZ
MDLDRAAVESRIDRRYLEALERGAGPREFPSPMYARIFLREYARYLGLNPRPLVSAYRNAHPDHDRPLFGDPPSLLRAPRRWTRPLLTLASIAGLVALVVVSVRSDGDVLVPAREIGLAPATPLPAAPVEPSSGELSTAEPSTTLADVVAAPVHVRLEVVDAPTWIRVTQGETVLVEGTEAPGYVTNILARDDLDLVLGNAGAVRLSLDGRELPLLGVEGDVYAGRLVVKNGRARLERVP